MDLESEPFDIAKLVEGCLDLVSLPVAQKEIELVCDIDPALPAEWIGDAARLRQVLINLVGNATKFTHSGEIVVRVDCVRLEGDRCLAKFEVRDTGIGIPLEQHGRIFDVFCQADGSTSRKYGGTGLGLAIASRLVALMGGQLTLASVPDDGSCFSFTIETKVRPEISVIDPGGLVGQAAFISESNPSCYLAIERALRHAGAEITSVAERASVIVSTEEHEWSAPVIQLIPVGNPVGNPVAGRHRASSILRKPVAARALVHACQVATGTEVMAPANAGTHAGQHVSRIVRPWEESGQLTILLAEDNKVNQMLAARTLEKGGYRVVIASNGVEAVRMTTEENPALVLMDIQMPEMDGFEATSRILEAQRNRGLDAIPVIAMTAHALKGDRERCLAKGMVDYLSKPVRPSQLLEIVEKYSAKPTARLM
jgi:CheY-like chemotaxis protein